MHLGSALLIVWLIIGGFAAGQRGDYHGLGKLHQGRHGRGDDPAGRPTTWGREPARPLHLAAAQHLVSV